MATTVLIATVALVPLLALAIRRRTQARVRYWTARCLVLAISLLLAAGVAEAAAAACLWARVFPMPWLPTRFADRPADHVVDVLVIGESSARDVPYDKWLSVADIVAWKLREAFPTRLSRSKTRRLPGFRFRPCTPSSPASRGVPSW